MLTMGLQDQSRAIALLSLTQQVRQKDRRIDFLRKTTFSQISEDKPTRKVKPG